MDRLDCSEGSLGCLCVEFGDSCPVGHMKFTIREQYNPQKGRPDGQNNELISVILSDGEETRVPRYFFTIRTLSGESVFRRGIRTPFSG